MDRNDLGVLDPTADRTLDPYYKEGGRRGRSGPSGDRTGPEFPGRRGGRDD